MCNLLASWSHVTVPLSRSFRLINTDTDILVVNKVNQWHDKTVQSVIITNRRFDGIWKCGSPKNKPPVKCGSTKPMNKNDWKTFSLHYIMYSVTPPGPKIVPLWLERQSLNPYARIELNPSPICVSTRKIRITKQAKKKTDLEQVLLPRTSP